MHSVIESIKFRITSEMGSTLFSRTIGQHEEMITFNIKLHSNARAHTRRQCVVAITMKFNFV